VCSRHLVGSPLLLLLDAGFEEFTLQSIELLSVGLRPISRHGQAGALVQKAVVASVVLPLAGGLGELAMDPQSGPVCIDPPAELGPTPDQGLMGHFDVTLLVSSISLLRRPPPAFSGDQPGIC
jgi:hypothetical protein